MLINLKTIIPSLIIFWALFKRWYDKLAKIIEPVVAKVEELAKDGSINKADRKAIAMEIITSLETTGKIPKMNFITKVIVSKIVDKLASKLPDYIVSEELKTFNVKP